MTDWVDMTAAEQVEFLKDSVTKRKEDGKHVFEKEKSEFDWDAVEGPGPAAMAVESSQEGEEHGNTEYFKEPIQDGGGDEPMEGLMNVGVKTDGTLGQPGKPSERQWDLTKGPDPSRKIFPDLKADPEDPSNPDHYKLLSRECIDIIEDFLTPEEFLGLLKGSLYQYLYRYKAKGGLKDLDKAKWYLDKLIEVESR